MIEVLTGARAFIACATILASETKEGKYPALEGTAGYFQDNGVVVAFDNTTCDCWVEEFKSSKKAVNWILDKISTTGK